VKIEKLKAGDVLYDVHSYRMGNTKMRSVGVWEVSVKEVHLTPEVGAPYIIASWNGNRAEKMYGRQIERLRSKRPMLIRTTTGRTRLATREEIKMARITNAGEK